MTETMTAMCAGGGWFVGIFAVLLLIVLILAGAALLKYLLTGHRRQAA